MLLEGELAELVESIRANGLRQPVVVTGDGLILDGRNRYAACQRLGIEPETVVYESTDLAEYVIDCNVRRNMATGARAMATATVLEADGRRDGGRWKRGSLDGNQEFLNSDWRNKITQCGIVLDYKPDLAESVVNGDLALDAAFKQADTIRNSAEHEKIRAREQAKRERDKAKEEAEHNAQIVVDLTQSESKCLAFINDDLMTPTAAWAAHQESTTHSASQDVIGRATHVRPILCLCSRVPTASMEGSRGLGIQNFHSADDPSRITSTFEFFGTGINNHPLRQPS